MIWIKITAHRLFKFLLCLILAVLLTVQMVVLPVGSGSAFASLLHVGGATSRLPDLGASDASGSCACRNKDKEIWSVTLVADDGQSETLGATAEHPFFVDGKGWVEASDLMPGDQVQSHETGEGQGGFLLVKSVQIQDKRQDTYNFEVADTHTYFVGKLKAWVHNACTAKFGDFSDHYTRHGQAAGMTKAEYKASAQSHIQPRNAGWSGRFIHNGETRMGHVSNTGRTNSKGEPLYVFSSSTVSRNRIYTHMPEGVTAQYLRNQGITLPSGF